MKKLILYSRRAYSLCFQYFRFPTYLKCTRPQRGRARGFFVSVAIFQVDIVVMSFKISTIRRNSVKKVNLPENYIVIKCLHACITDRLLVMNVVSVDNSENPLKESIALITHQMHQTKFLQ